MRPSIKIALLFVAIWFAGKMIFFYTQTFQLAEEYKYLVVWNIACLLVGMAVGTYFEKRNESRVDSSALGDIKSTMRGGMIYTIIVAGCLYLYYSKIDPAYNQAQIAVADAEIRKSISNPNDLKEIKKLRVEYSSMSNEEIFTDMSKSPRVMFSAGTTFVMSLLSMLLLTTINSIILTVIFRRLLFREGTF